MQNKQLLAQGNVEIDQVGQQLGIYARQVLGISSRQLQKVVRTKGLLVNGRPRHSKTKLKLNDNVEAFLPQTEQIKIPVASPSRLTILYEDSWLLGVEKPAGIPSYNLNDTEGLANQVVGYFLNQGLKITPRPLHRLDTPTSGVLIFAKDAKTQTILAKSWQQGKVQRFYWGICQGKILKSLELTMPLDGLDAYTKVVPVQVYENWTELKIQLITGRTHQIRQHLAAINHPLLGERRYSSRLGQKEHTRLALHATQVCFVHPYHKEQMVSIESPIPYGDFAYLKMLN